MTVLQPVNNPELLSRLKTMHPPESWCLKADSFYLDRRGGVYLVTDVNMSDERPCMTVCISPPLKNDYDENAGDTHAHYLNGVDHPESEQRIGQDQCRLVMECNQHGVPLQSIATRRHYLKMALKLTADRLDIELPENFCETLMSTLDGRTLDVLFDAASDSQEMYHDV